MRSNQTNKMKTGAHSGCKSSSAHYHTQFICVASFRKGVLSSHTQLRCSFERLWYSKMAFVTTPTLLCSSFLSVKPSPTCARIRPHFRRHRGLRMSAEGGGQDQSSSLSSSPPADSSSSMKGGDVQKLREVVLDENIGGFCSINPRTGLRLELSLREKESLFLDAMQAYFRGSPIVSNAEFDALKEELTWQGSDVISLERDEFRFLDAAKAYERGSATISDEEFDKLKTKLQQQGSIVAIQRGPRCSIKRQLTFSDVIVDKRRTFALFLPAGIFIGLVWLSFSFEVTPLHNVDPVISLIIGSPLIALASRLITGLVVPQAEIMVGDCPSCGRRTHVLFGNVLNQEGFSDTADVACSKCKAKLKVERQTNRMILIAEGK